MELLLISQKKDLGILEKLVSQFRPILIASLSTPSSEALALFSAIKQLLAVIRARTQFILHFEKYEGYHGITLFQDTQRYNVSRDVSVLEMYCDHRLGVIETQLHLFINQFEQICQEMNHFQDFMRGFQQTISHLTL
jgi:hypothetical protein